MARVRGIQRYKDVLARLSFDYVGGHEYGFVPDRPYTVFIAPLRHSTVDELHDTVTHEVVHYVHRRWKDEVDKPTDRIRTKTWALMASPSWRLAVSRRLNEELLRLLKGAVSADVIDAVREGAAKCRSRVRA